MAVRAERRALVSRAERLAGVLDEREAVPFAELDQRVELARVAEDVDRDDRLRPLGDRRLDRGRVEVVRARVDVREHRRRALVDRAVRGRDERERRRDHLVAGADARQPHRKVQAGGAARDRGAVSRADGLGEQLLEARPGRPEREPAGAQRLEHELLVALVDPRRAEREPVLVAWVTPAARAKFSTGSRQCAQRSVSPLPFTVSRYAFWIAFVISPTPISMSSTSRIGVTSAAVPHMKTSSAIMQVGADQVLLDDGVALVLRDLDDRVARDARQDPGREIRRVDDAVLDDEDVLARAVRDVAVVGEHDRFLVAGVVRLRDGEHRVEVDAGRLRDVRDHVRADALPRRDLRRGCRSAVRRRRGTCPTASS